MNKSEIKSTPIETAAKLIRIITVPPIMVAALIIYTAVARNDIFMSALDVTMALFCLSVLPTLAYPFSLLPKLRVRGREGQRSLAMILSALGYAIGAAYALIAGRSELLCFFFACYLISVLLLVLFNKALKIRASGHACSIAGPIVLLAVLSGVWGIVFGAVLYALSFWSSVYLKRHTVCEYLLGSATAFAACLISYLIFLI